MSVAMGLEPVVAEAQQCTEAERPQNNWWKVWMIFLEIFFALAIGLICRWFYELVKRLRKDVENNQIQLGDHYEYAAWLCEMNDLLDNMGWIRDASESLGYRLDEVNGLVREHIADTRDVLTVLDDATDVIRYGLM